MTRNKQLTFPFDNKSYLSPFDSKYLDKLETINFGENGDRPRDVQTNLQSAADIISTAFNWEDTVEGMYFWAHACDALQAMSEEMEHRNNPNDDDSVLVVNASFGGCMADFDFDFPMSSVRILDDDT